MTRTKQTARKSIAALANRVLNSPSSTSEDEEGEEEIGEPPACCKAATRNA